MKLEIEKASLTTKLWDLANNSGGEGEGEGGSGGGDKASASAREEVAKVWPTVEATFQKLSLGIDVLKSKLARETAAREAAEAKLRGGR